MRGRSKLSEELREHPDRYLIPPPTKEIEYIGEPTSALTLSFKDIMQLARGLDERNSIENGSVNVGIFTSVISGLIENLPEINEEQDPPAVNRLKKAFRDSGCLSLVVFDMDDLTRLNSTYSHLHGSLVCSVFGFLLARNAMFNGGATALMGEENWLALPLDLFKMYEESMKILAKFSNVYFDFGSGTFRQGVTAGISSISHIEPKTFRILFDFASGALVFGKRNGKGIATMFGERAHE